MPDNVFEEVFREDIESLRRKADSVVTYSKECHIEASFRELLALDEDFRLLSSRLRRRYIGVSRETARALATEVAKLQDDTIKGVVTNLTTSCSCKEA